MSKVFKPMAGTMNWPCAAELELQRSIDTGGSPAEEVEANTDIDMVIEIDVDFTPAGPESARLAKLMMEAVWEAK